MPRCWHAAASRYSKESYLELVDHIRSIIPDVTFSTDMIAGFCGETEADHLDSVDLLDRVKFNQGFLYAYSMRAKTNAYGNFDVVCGPVCTYHRLFTTLHVPFDVPCLATMVIGC